MAEKNKQSAVQLAEQGVKSELEEAPAEHARELTELKAKIAQTYIQNLGQSIERGTGN